MTQYVECHECDGQRYVVLQGRKVLCDICEGDGHIPMPDIPHIMRIEESEGGYD